MVVRQSELYVGTGGVEGEATVWKQAASEWQPFSTHGPGKIAVLQTDATGNLYVGGGNVHVQGTAFLGRFDAANQYELLATFPNHDTVYSATWYHGRLHIGLAADELHPGSAEVWRFDDPGWTRIGGAGTPGWPVTNRSFTAYELWELNGNLYVSTYSDTLGDGTVLQLGSAGWVDLQVPPTIAVIAMVTYQGKLTIAVSNAQTNYPNVVFQLQPDGSWLPLGEGPEEWSGAYIPNHLVADPANGDLWLGIGGQPGETSVWRYNGSWSKQAGGGLNGSWSGAFTTKGSEWIYRMHWHNGELYVGIASDYDDVAQVWKMDRSMQWNKTLDAVH